MSWSGAHEYELLVYPCPTNHVQGIRVTGTITCNSNVGVSCNDRVVNLSNYVMVRHVQEAT